MKKLIVVLFLTILSISNAQENDWQIGLNINPFIFSRINSEFNYDKDKQNLPNGLGFGFTIEKNWNEHWGIKTGFESTKQNEKYLANDTRIESNFKYNKIPITIQYYHPINEKLFLTFNQGFQFSFLKNFKTVISDEYQVSTFSSSYYEYISFPFPENNIYSSNYKVVFHNDTLYGIIGSIGLKGFLSNKITYSTNLRYEYDINSADNIPYYSTTPGNTKPEGTTRNFRFGLEIGFQYHFSIDSYRFDKRPHKI